VSKIWALGQVVVGGLILAAEISFWVQFFCSNAAIRAIWNNGLENQFTTVVQTLLAIGTAIVMIAVGVDELRVRAVKGNQQTKKPKNGG